MGGSTLIEWATAVWNPVTGCSPVSEGCRHCYARRMARRLAGRCGYPEDDPFRVTLRPERLEEPSHWRKPRMVFVVSMGDLFHPEVPFEFVTRMFGVMRALARHTFLVLTKRPGRLTEFLEWRKSNSSAPKGSEGHIWLGVTIESHRYAAARTPEFLKAGWRGIRYVSCEPLLEAVDLSPWLSSFDWVIVGGESGPGARPMDPDWARALRDECASTGTAYFFKQFGEWAPAEDEKRLEGAGFGATRKHVFASGNTVWRIGKKAAGRILDGRLWNEYPDSMTTCRVPS